MHTCKCKAFLFGIGVLLMLATRPAAAQLDLVFSQNIFVQQPGDTFSVGAVVSNPFTNTNTYTLDNYFLSISPLGASPALNLGTDITEDPTGFFTTFARSYAPGESATGNIFDFALSNTAPDGRLQCQRVPPRSFGCSIRPEQFRAANPAESPTHS